MASVVTSTGLAHYHEKVKELLNNKADYRSTKSFQENTGKAVYVKLFTLTITSNYADINYEFAVTRRGNGPSYVNLYVQSANDKYASDIKLTYRGLNGDVESNLKAYHYKDTTKTVSTIQVWYKVNAWDDIKFFNKTFSPRYGTLTWESTLTAGTAFPTDATATIDCTRSTFHANLDWGYITGKPSSYTPSAHNHSVILDGNNAKSISLCYSKSGLNYDDYNWIAAWNGYELRSVNKSQFATANHTHDTMTTAEIDALFA